MNNNIVSILIEYLNIQNTNLIIENISVTDKKTLNSACFELLGWLKLEYKRQKWIEEGRKASNKPLELNRSYEWCNLINDLVLTETLFSELFDIKDDKLFFKDSIPETTKNEIRKDAFEKYNPPVIR